MRLACYALYPLRLWRRTGALRPLPPVERFHWLPTRQAGSPDLWNNPGNTDKSPGTITTALE